MSGNNPGGYLRLVSSEDDQTDSDFEDTEHRESDDEELPTAGIPRKPSSEHMEDKDIQRLEDRIEAAEERGRLRLEVAITKIDGKLDSLAASIQDVSRFSSAQAAESAARHRELRNTIIATGLAVIFGIVSMLIGLKQVWIGGVEVGLPLGQAIQAQPFTPAMPSASPMASPPTLSTTPGRQQTPLLVPPSQGPSTTKPNG